MTVFSQLVHNLKVCHLLISNTRVDGKPGIDLIKELRKGLLILREPFTADELREAVGSLLPRRMINSDGQR